MKIHKLKIKHEYLEEVELGRKSFELRKNDRDYQIGDIISFIDIDKNICKDDLYEITYILKDVPGYGLSSEYCILGIKKIERNEVK